MCSQQLILQRKCTSVLVETEKNAHSQSNAVSFAVTIFLPGLTGSELRLFKNLTQSEDCGSVIFLFLLYRRSGVFLWIATAYMACLSVDEVNGAL